ncbi:hypothetical protein BDQ17DRAFT_1416166 [Cyathus striatus]|nr:hypothetical protein BDQ17DRAFT_1416166 [Cyathus striatus]
MGSPGSPIWKQLYENALRREQQELEDKDRRRREREDQERREQERKDQERRERIRGEQLRLEKERRNQQQQLYAWVPVPVAVPVTPFVYTPAYVAPPDSPGRWDRLNHAAEQEESMFRRLQKAADILRSGRWRRDQERPWAR